MIREANLNDMDSLVELGQILSMHERMSDPYLKPISKQHTENKYSQEIKNPNSKFFVFEHEDKIVGYIYGFIKKPPSHISGHKIIGYIEACIVKETYRGKNISRKLTNALKDWFKSKDVSLVELGVYADNESLEVWKKLGFKPHHISMRKLLD